MTRLAAALALLVTASSASAADEEAIAARLAPFLEATGYRYSKVAPTQWTFRFEGDHERDIVVYVMGFEESTSIVGVIASGRDVPDPAAIGTPLLRLNNDPAANILIDVDGDYVARAVLPADELKPAPFKERLEAVVRITDDAYGAIRSHVRAADDASPRTITAPASATAVATLLGGKARVRYDPAKWGTPVTKQTGRLEMRHTSGDLYAVVISERMAVPATALRQIALSNVEEAGGKLGAVVEERRKVNGADVIFLEYDATVKDIPLKYWGHFYAGEQGTIQVIAYTAQNLVQEYRADVEELLSGLSVP